MTNFIVAATEIETGASFPVRHNRPIHPNEPPAIARETAPKSCFVLETYAEAEDFKTRLGSIQQQRWSFSVLPF